MRHSPPSTKPNHNVPLARVIFGNDLQVMSPAQVFGNMDEDPTPEEEARLEKARTEPLGRVEVMRRRDALIQALKDMEAVSSRVGSNAYDDATGSWSNDLPEGGHDVLEEVGREVRDHAKRVVTIFRKLDACYANDPAFNQPD